MLFDGGLISVVDARRLLETIRAFRISEAEIQSDQLVAGDGRMHMVDKELGVDDPVGNSVTSRITLIESRDRVDQWNVISLRRSHSRHRRSAWSRGADRRRNRVPPSGTGVPRLHPLDRNAIDRPRS